MTTKQGSVCQHEKVNYQEHQRTLVYQVLEWDADTKEVLIDPMDWEDTSGVVDTTINCHWCDKVLAHQPVVVDEGEER